MKEFLKRMRLLDTLTTHLPMKKTEFAEKLSQVVEPGEKEDLFNSWEAYSDKKEFRGIVSPEGFELRKKRLLFGAHNITVVAKGSVIENGRQLTVETEINGLNSPLIRYYVLLVLFYLIAIFSILNSNMPFFPIPILLFHSAFMILVPYFKAVRGVQKLKYELEREFFYLTKNSLPVM